MKRKLMTSALIIAMLAVLVAGASLAYFTDTDSATNTFTVGNVDITLTEPNYVGDDNAVVMPGKTIVKDPTVTVADNSQDCYLFVEIDWSRYISYIDNAINLGIIENYADLLDTQKRIAFFDAYIDGFNHADWKVMNMDEIAAVFQNHQAGEAWPAYLNIKLGYQGGENNGVLSAKDTVKIFDAIKMPKEATQDSMKLFYKYADGTDKTGTNTVELKITAKAIQAAEIADLDAAYKALYNIQ